MAQSQPSCIAHLLTLTAVPETFPKAGFHPKPVKGDRRDRISDVVSGGALVLCSAAGTRVDEWSIKFYLPIITVTILVLIDLF